MTDIPQTIAEMEIAEAPVQANTLKKILAIAITSDTALLGAAMVGLAKFIEQYGYEFAQQAILDELIATRQEANLGTITEKLITPALMKGYIDNRRATQAEALAGTSNTKLMTPQRTKQAIAAQTPALAIPSIVYLTGQTNTNRSYAIPAGTMAMKVIAFGAGSGARNERNLGTAATDTSASIANELNVFNLIAAGGTTSTSQAPAIPSRSLPAQPASPTGLTFKGGGNQGGRDIANVSASASAFGQNGARVELFIRATQLSGNPANFTGKRINYRLGAGGEGGRDFGDGQDGHIELWLW